MKMKGNPLQITFTHVENGPIKKTIARCTVTERNVPAIIYCEFFELFDKNKNNRLVAFYPSVKLYAETVCKPEDNYDPAVGERIARKKIMKKFMSMIRQAANERSKYLNDELNDCITLASFAKRSENKIIDYLKEQ